MRGVVFAVFLVIAGNAAAAEWAHIGHNADGEATFVDSRSIKKKGSVVTANVLVNHNSQSSYVSSRTTTSFDCKERRMQLISIKTYQQADAKGSPEKVINPNLGWGAIRAKTIGEKQWEFVCTPKPASTQAAVKYAPTDPRTIFKTGARLGSGELGSLMDKHFPDAKYRPNNTMLVTHQNQTFVITVQKIDDVSIPAIYKIVSVLPQ